MQRARAPIIADNLIAEGKMVPMIIVFPSGNATATPADENLLDKTKVRRPLSRLEKFAVIMGATKGEPDDNIKVGANYVPKDGKLEASGGFVSQVNEDAAVRKANYQESIGWYASIVSDMFAKPPAPAKGAPPAKKG